MLFTNCDNKSSSTVDKDNQSSSTVDKDNQSSTTVDKIEDCLGEIKTGKQLRRLTKTERTSIGLCVLPHIKKFTTKLKNSDATTRESLIKEFFEAVNESENEEAIHFSYVYEYIAKYWKSNSQIRQTLLKIK
jgi:hypothetical protein